MVTTAFLDDSVLRASHASEISAYYYSIHLYSSIGYWIGYYYTYTYSTYSIGRFYRYMSGSCSRTGKKCGKPDHPRWVLPWSLNNICRIIQREGVTYFFICHVPARNLQPLSAMFRRGIYRIRCQCYELLYSTLLYYRDKLPLLYYIQYSCTMPLYRYR